MKKDNVFDLNEFKLKKEIKQKEEEKKKEEAKIEELFKQIITKPFKDLTEEEKVYYNEVGLLCQFNLKNTYSMALAVFRKQVYIVNYVGNETFEYLGKFEDIISKGLFGE